MHRRMAALLACLLIAVVAGCGQTPAAAGDDPVRILHGEPTTLDPAAAGDAGSAALIAQLFETVTTFDSDRVLRPAIAESWRIEDDGRRIVFRLRDGLTFSDGTPLVAADVVRSWFRVIDPARPSPLVSLMSDVAGALAYARGQGSAGDVGLRADDAANEVVVEMVRPSADFVTVVTSPTFAIVPPSIDSDPSAFAPDDGFVASGGYRLTGSTATTLELSANPAYWAGPPAVATITIVTDLGGASAVEAFEDGGLDYAPIGSFDASWIAYDADLGPALRSVPSLSTNYYGFDVREPPFDDVLVRRAFASAVDWRRIARLSEPDPAAVATSMVPPGIPGRSDADFLPAYDPDAARAALADAGYPGGAGFPDVVLLTGGTPWDEAIVVELRRELGIDLRSETMDFGTYFARLDDDPPAMWSLSWVADYPGRNDFLGVLLGTGSSNNYGGWSSAEFDAAIEDAASAADPVTAAAAYDRAEAIVRDDAPVIPVSYGSGWALSREGLLGAGQNGLGMLRMAGLAWAP
ncbi:MAG: ABC transporter substrate-binding protein [Candidatus Limnocylindria bacterium]